jgi:hypothetical protein
MAEFQDPKTRIFTLKINKKDNLKNRARTLEKTLVQKNTLLILVLKLVLFSSFVKDKYRIYPTNIECRSYGMWDIIHHSYVSEFENTTNTLSTNQNQTVSKAAGLFLPCSLNPLLISNVGETVQIIIL